MVMTSQVEGLSVVLLLSTELLDPIESCRASAEVSEVGWIEPSGVGRLSSINARLLRGVVAAHVAER